MMSFLEQLNQQQLEAVKYIDGPMVIFAGAGTGKTRVITYRIAYLLSRGISPYNILAVTFTNKAAEEMKQRVIELVPDKGKYVWISTFHSLCASILYLEKENFGISNFVIYDEEDSVKLIKETLKELSLENHKISPYDIYEKICRAKDHLIDATSYQINAEVKHDPIGEIIAEIYIRYQKKLEENYAFDFGDLLMKVIELFKDPQYEKIKQKYVERFKFIHVDEYQDVNYAQVVLLKILSSKYNNVCVVGDDDQAIYSWRGSDVFYLLNFSNDFSTKDLQVKKFKLEKNYRSKQSILDVSNTLISNNKNRHKKVLFSDIKGDINEDIIIRQLNDEYEEAKFVAKNIINLRNKKDFSIAVLYRTNLQSRVFEEVFMEYNIPYKIVGSVGFYERREIKDILAYLRILINPFDEVSLKRIINVPNRGIGDTTILYLSTLSKENKISLWQQLLKVDDTELSLKVKNSIWKFLALYDILKKCKDTMFPSEFLKFLIDKINYIEFIEENYKSQEKIERIENLQQLISLAKEYETKEEALTIEEFLNKISLFTSSDIMNDYKNYVYLMTLHIAKGLEFDVVFLVGLEEGNLPFYRVNNKSLFSRFIDTSYSECGNFSTSIEEERRLCYVGMTRAKKRLYLTYAAKRKIYGIEKEYMPSRFLDEILAVYNKNFQEQEELFSNYKVDFKDSPSIDMLKIGEYVIHDKFGLGKVVDIVRETSGNNKVVVLFQDGQERKLSLTYAKLKKV
ncbi:MAG: UvrD-helicase domain-containing protein [Endomicrobia bacterium]|nr:UvrD-helicase domain-containing protein [Endomicrobiia bacterium]